MQQDAAPMNSREWWESYFAGQWDANNGTAQTRHFMDRLLARLPAAEASYLRSRSLDVLDWGCAFGEGVDRLAREFPRCRVSGLDFAAAAVEEARRRYPHNEFILGEGGIPRTVDVIFTSNCLEHFSDPLSVMREHLRHCRKLYVAMVPYNEHPLCPYHTSQFREESFPPTVGGFTRLDVKRVDVDPAFWPGQQLLAVYGSPEYLRERESAQLSPAEREKWEKFYASLPLVDEDAALRGFNEELVAKVSSLMPEGGTTLEAGCGAGWQSLALGRSGRFRVTLLDFAASALAYARRIFERERVEATFVQEDVLAPPPVEGDGVGAAETSRFDLVLNAGVLEHYTFDEQVAFLRAMARRSRRYVMVLVPNRLCYWYWLWRVQKGAQGAWPYGKEVPLADLSAAFRAAGLQFVGQAVMGGTWTENFIGDLAGLDPALRDEVLAVHRSPVIPDEQRGYLVAAVGSVSPEPQPVPAGWSSPSASRGGTAESVDNVQTLAAVADGLALRVAAEADLKRLQAEAADAARRHADDRRRMDEAEARARETGEQLVWYDATNHQLEIRIEELAARCQEQEAAAREAALKQRAECQALEARALELRSQLKGLREQVDAANERREAMRAALAREQQARHLLEATAAGNYPELLGGVSDIVASVAPRGATVLVVSKGDPELLRLSGRRGWHFPRGEGGQWAGYHPSDSRAAIEHLEAQRAEGADYLLLPAAAFWWLEYYAEFAAHLDARYHRVWEDDRCIVYRLSDANGGRLNGWGRRLMERVGRVLPRVVQPAQRNGSLARRSRPTPRRGRNGDGSTANAAARGAAEPAAGSASRRGSGAYDVLCFPIVDWDYRFQRPQQLMSRFAAAGHRVFYIAKEFRQAGPPSVVRENRPNIFEVSLRGPKRNVYRDAMDAKAADELSAALQSLRTERAVGTAVAVVQLPFWWPLAERAKALFGCVVVYDCMDDHAAFGTNDPLMLEQETELARSADLVVASAAPLAERLKKLRGDQPGRDEDVVVVRNACDYDHFAAAPDKAPGGRPAIGYHGAIAEWFDADLVADLATRRPDWDFLLVGGTVGADTRRLATLPNVRLVGEVPYAELPRWLGRFDVSVIPFKLTPLTHATNPVKAYESFAAGRPVVSTPLPEVQAMAPLARTATGAEGFEREIAAALEDRDPRESERRRAFARRNTWQDRFSCLSAAIAKRLPSLGDATTTSSAHAASPAAVPRPAAEASRVVIFASVPYDDIGGGQRSAQLARALLRRGYRLTYLYAYPKMDVNTGAPIPSAVNLPRLEHRSVHEVTPAELLSASREDTTFIFELPHPAFLPFAELAQTRGLRTVFELIDDWDSSLGAAWYDPEVMRRFVAGCTVNVGTARVLLDRLRAAGARDPLYLPNAADEAVFDAYKTYPRPADYPAGYARTLLYFGSLYGEWFGWEYVRAAAERNPDTAVVLIGDDPGTQAMPANVLSLGPRSNSDLPAYLAHADAALIPFRPCPITDAVSPVKVFEYLFLRKPVIATRMPELDGLPHVHQAATPEEFAALCADVPGRPVDPAPLDLFVSRNSWNARLDSLVPRPRPRRRFSFIILIHNNAPIISRCLTTLTEHTGSVDGEIIVVDNASTDGGDRLVENEFPHVKLVRNAKNGASSGRNLGAAAAGGDCLVFFDSDQWFTSDAWAYEADEVLRNHPVVGALGWNAGWFDPGLDSLGGPTVDHLPGRARNAAVERDGFRTDVAYLATSGMFIPRPVWERCSGFDPFYDPHIFEDTDLSFQVLKLGLRIAYRDLTGIRHQPHQTTRAAAADEQYVRLFKRNSAYFKNKWADRLDLFSPPLENRETRHAGA